MTRIHASLNILDSIIRSLAMSYLDANNPSASTFTRNAVPVVEVSAEPYFSPTQPYITSMSMPSPIQQYAQPQQIGVDPTVRPANCPCDSLSLGYQWPESHTQVPGWIATAGWNREWTEGEIRKEECRRLCWSTLMLVSGHTSFSAAVNWRSLDLFVGEPSNVRGVLNRLTPLTEAAHLPCSIRFYSRESLYSRPTLMATSTLSAAKVRFGPSTFARCCSGMRACACGTIPVSATWTGETLPCARGSRRRR